MVHEGDTHVEPPWIPLVPLNPVCLSFCGSIQYGESLGDRAQRLPTEWLAVFLPGVSVELSHQWRVIGERELIIYFQDGCPGVVPVPFGFAYVVVVSVRCDSSSTRAPCAQAATLADTASGRDVTRGGLGGAAALITDTPAVMDWANAGENASACDASATTNDATDTPTTADSTRIEPRDVAT